MITATAPRWWTFRPAQPSGPSMPILGKRLASSALLRHEAIIWMPDEMPMFPPTLKHREHRHSSHALLVVRL